ncbi:MAG: hypothetical protein EA381_04600 [Planctomycetaceae bacterium]|nr:MAG: hypothetical protein EA381_04600 [Planctomycetaceae bacterium]
MKEQIDYPSAGKTHEVRFSGEQLKPTTDLVEYFQQYTREKPEVVAMWCFGIGFVLGWKLKPW